MGMHTLLLVIGILGSAIGLATSVLNFIHNNETISDKIINILFGILTLGIIYVTIYYILFWY